VPGFLAKHAETLSIIRRAAAMPDCHFDVDYSPGLERSLPAGTKLPRCVDLVKLHALYELSHGRTDSVINDINCLLGWPVISAPYQKSMPCGLPG